MKRESYSVAAQALGSSVFWSQSFSRGCFNMSDSKPRLRPGFRYIGEARDGDKLCTSKGVLYRVNPESPPEFWTGLRWKEVNLCVNDSPEMDGCDE